MSASFYTGQDVHPTGYTKIQPRKPMKTHENPTIMFLDVSRLLQVVIALGSLVY